MVVVYAVAVREVRGAQCARSALIVNAASEIIRTQPVAPRPRVGGPAWTAVGREPVRVGRVWHEVCLWNPPIAADAKLATVLVALSLAALGPAGLHGPEWATSAILFVVCVAQGVGEVWTPTPCVRALFAFHNTQSSAC